MLKILHSYKHSTSIFDDFIHYEKRQEEDEVRKPVYKNGDGGHGRNGHGGGVRDRREDREHGGGRDDGRDDRRNDRREDKRDERRDRNRERDRETGEGREARDGGGRDLRDRAEASSRKDVEKGGHGQGRNGVPPPKK